MNVFLFLLVLFLRTPLAAASADSCDPAASPDSCIKDQKSDTPYEDTQDATSLLQQKIEMSERLAKPQAAMVDAAKSSTAHSTLKDIEQGFHDLYNKWSALEEDPEFSHLQNDFFNEFESIEESIDKMQIAWHAMTLQNTTTSLTQNVLQHDDVSLDKTAEGKRIRTGTGLDGCPSDYAHTCERSWISPRIGIGCCCNACNWDWAWCTDWGSPASNCGSWAFEGGSSNALGDWSTGMLAYTDGSNDCKDISCAACNWDWRECSGWNWADCKSWVSIYQGGTGCQDLGARCADIATYDRKEHRRRRNFGRHQHRRRWTVDACNNRLT